MRREIYVHSLEFTVFCVNRDTLAGVIFEPVTYGFYELYNPYLAVSPLTMYFYQGALIRNHVYMPRSK